MSQNLSIKTMLDVETVDENDFAVLDKRAYIFCCEEILDARRVSVNLLADLVRTVKSDDDDAPITPCRVNKNHKIEELANCLKVTLSRGIRKYEAYFEEEGEGLSESPDSSDSLRDKYNIFRISDETSKAEFVEKATAFFRPMKQHPPTLRTAPCMHGAYEDLEALQLSPQDDLGSESNPIPILLYSQPQCSLCYETKPWAISVVEWLSANSACPKVRLVFYDLEQNDFAPRMPVEKRTPCLFVGAKNETDTNLRNWKWREVDDLEPIELLKLLAPQEVFESPACQEWVSQLDQKNEEMNALFSELLRLRRRTAIMTLCVPRMLISETMANITVDNFFDELLKSKEYLEAEMRVPEYKVAEDVMQETQLEGHGLESVDRRIAILKTCCSECETDYIGLSQIFLAAFLAKGVAVPGQEGQSTAVSS